MEFDVKNSAGQLAKFFMNNKIWFNKLKYVWKNLTETIKKDN